MAEPEIESPAEIGDPLHGAADPAQSRLKWIIRFGLLGVALILFELTANIVPDHGRGVSGVWSGRLHDRRLDPVA